MLLFLAVQVPVMLLLALVAAFAIDSARLHAAGFFRIVIFLPYAVPGVVAVLMWGFIYGDHFGLAADLNHLLGTDAVQAASAELDPRLHRQHRHLGVRRLQHADLLLGAQGRAAGPVRGRRDRRRRRAAHDPGVKLPALRGAIVIATIFSIIGSFQLFNEPNILRTLAPNVITTFFTPNMYAYNLSFAGQQYNYSATVAIVMGVITAVIAYVVQLRGSREGV